MKKKVILCAIAITTVCLSGCQWAESSAQYNTDGIEYIAYTDIDTVCDNAQLSEEGGSLLSSVDSQMLISFVVDSSIEMTQSELGEYDHLIISNIQWINRFGDSKNLKPIEYDSLPNDTKNFLEMQMPIWTIDGSVFPEGIHLYQYENDNLFAFPVNVTLGGNKPIEAENPLVILVEEPAQTFKADSFMLPLTSSGNILFENSDEFKTLFEESNLAPYGSIQELETVLN